jgi:hypothetical protein
MVADDGIAITGRELPGLYLAILERVAELETAGRRREAGRVRRAATKAYSRAWDERARRALIDLLRDADQRTVAAAAEPTGRRVSRSLPGIVARRARPVTSDR